MGGEAGEFIHAEQHVQAWLGVAQLEQEGSAARTLIFVPRASPAHLNLDITSTCSSCSFFFQHNGAPAISCF
jgi:hypothetical protein